MEDSKPPDSDWLHGHRNRVRSDAKVRLDLFVRTLGAPIGTHGRQSALLDRVTTLDRRDAVEETRVTVWGDQVCVSSCCADNPAVESTRATIERFRKWARHTAGVSVSFDRHTVDSAITGDRYDVVDLPTVCLAVSVDSTLDGVLPATVGDERWTVGTYLEWFERARNSTESQPLADA